MIEPIPRVAMPPSAGPGWAYINSSELVGIAPDGTVHAIVPPTGRAAGVVRGTDGHAYALVAEGEHAIRVSRLEGDRLVDLGAVPECTLWHRVFDARDGQMALSCAEGIFERKPDGWQRVSLPHSNADEHGLWFARSGELWFLTRASAHVRRADGWAVSITERLEDEPTALYDGREAVYLATPHALFRVADGKQHLVRRSMRSMLVPSSSGLLGFPSDETLALFTAEGDVATVPTAGATLDRGHLDDRGRVWSLLAGQLEVADPSVAKITTVPMGAYAALDDVESDTDMVVLGAGPEVPASRPVRRTKAVKARLVLGGKPLAHVRVELCARSFTGWPPVSRHCFRRIPLHGGQCIASDRLIATAVTDAAGSFTIENAPMGTYYLHHALEEPGRWSLDTTALRLREGAISDQGTIDVTPKK